MAILKLTVCCVCVCTYYVYVCVCVCACVQIFQYFDELELCNPLRSKRSIHKIGAYKPCIPDNFVIDISFYVQVLSTSLLVTFHQSIGQS